MPTKPTTTVSSANSQRDNRWLETVYDQHNWSRFPQGRPFWGYVEIPSDPKQAPAFCVEFQTGDHRDPDHSSWSAPWLPPQCAERTGKSYYRIDFRTHRLTWNYAAVIADDQAANLAYYRAAAKIANANGWRAPGLNEPVSFQIESILLDPPRSSKIAEAALAGDPWILGMTARPNEQLAQLLAGVRPRVGVPAVSVDDALRMGEGDTTLDARIAKAVAEALEKADADRKRAAQDRMARVRSKRRPRAPQAPSTPAEARP